jgi:hypothetical protein
MNFQLVNNFNQQSDHKQSSKSIVINNFGDYDDAEINIIPLNRVLKILKTPGPSWFPP